MASRKQIAAAKRNIKKAQAALKKKFRGSTKKRKSSSRSTRSSRSPMARSKSRTKRGFNVKNAAKKFGIGAGIGILFSLGAAALRSMGQSRAAQFVEPIAPVVDAFAGAGVEGQIGTIAVRSASNFIARRGFNSSNGTSQLSTMEGA